MNATRWMGLALGVTALVAGTGCGSGGAMSPMGASPSPPPEPGAYQPGYAGGDAPMAAPSAAPRYQQPAQEGRADAPIARKTELEADKPKDRPGLGTEWGETRVSRISTVPFVRADASSPFAAASLFYNDEEGARAMASQTGFHRTSAGSFSIGGGVASIGLRNERGSFLTGFVAGGRNFAVGDVGHRYVIVIKNHTQSRMEVVLSVDGLDVIDGRAAGFNKRGYLVDPNGEVEVDGFRQSNDTVAAFRFGSVRGSYAGLKTGDTRNVGVIGIALFNERGTRPFPWTDDEVQRRRDANPFPGQFATPPRM